MKEISGWSAVVTGADFDRADCGSRAAEGDHARDADAQPDEDKDECNPNADLERHLGLAK